MKDINNPCQNCKHSILTFVDIDGSGRHDYPEEECDYGGDCNEDNNYEGWEAEE